MEGCAWEAVGRIVPPVHMGLPHKTRFCKLGVTAPVRLDAPDAHFLVPDVVPRIIRMLPDSRRLVCPNMDL